jgi:hypothetical protein
VVLEHFVIKDSWAEKSLREDSLAVGRNDQAGHSRTLDRTYQRQDTQKIAKDFANMKPKAFMDMIVNTLTR